MSNTTWQWPLPGHSISSNYGQRGSRFHAGIDIPAPKGTPILATADGEVVSVRTNVSGFGCWIQIKHDNGLISTYGHMPSNMLYVKEGQTVKAGDIIAGVGNEGESYGANGGYHLHYQLNNGYYTGSSSGVGTSVNPLNYISPSGPTTVNDNYIPPSTTTSPGSDYPSTENITTPIAPIGNSEGISAIAQRVSDLTNQPIHAFIKIKLGNHLISNVVDPGSSNRPNMIMSFEVDKLEAAGSRATFTIFDDEWDIVEYYLLQNPYDISIQYGYPDGAQSEEWQYQLEYYNISFTTTGTILTVSCISTSVKANMSLVTMELNTYNPRQAAMAICRRMGYIVEEKNFDDATDVQSVNPFNMINEYPITYIKDVIIPAASDENEELFTFYIDESTRKAYFKRIGYKITPEERDGMKTYVYQKGYDSVVLDLSIDLKVVYAGSETLQIVTDYKGSVLDTQDKKENPYNINKKDAVTVATGDKIISGNSEMITDTSGYLESHARRRLYYYIKSTTTDGYEATMTIVGDPTLKVIGSNGDTHIRLLNITDRGSLHHTSGVYRVNRIIDRIDDGSMITTLKLIKNANYSDIDGLELISPYEITK